MSASHREHEQLDDVDLARSVAASTARILVETRQGFTGEADALKAVGDRTAQEHIADRLAIARPSDAVLSEEAMDSPARLTARRVWIVDPLDGTREYSEGRDDWAVHIALWEDGELSAAAVALGGAELVLTTADNDHATARPGSRPRIAVSRTRPPALVVDLAAELDAELVPMGSAGVKVCSVVRGETEAYVHGGGQYEWDSAAPVAVARAAGLYTSRLDGSPLRYNQPDPYLPDLIVCRPELTAELLAALSRIETHHP